MSEDKTAEDQKLTVTQGKENADKMMPLTKALVSVYSDAVERFEQLTAAVDLDTLSEKEGRPGLILMRVVIQSYKNQERPNVFVSNNYFDQRKLTSMAVNEIDQLVTSLPGWVPVLFENYREKFSSFPIEKLNDLVIFFGAYEIEQFFEENSTHNFIQECLLLSQNDTWTVNKQIGNNSVQLLNLEKILGNRLEAFRKALTEDDGFDILKKAVHQAVLKQQIETRLKTEKKPKNLPTG